MVYIGKIDDSEDVNRWFFDLETTHKRRNPHLFPSEQNPLRIINLAEAAKVVPGDVLTTSFIGPGKPPLSQDLYAL